MRILIFITRGDTIGGAQTHVIQLAKNLQNRKFKILVVYGGEKSKLYQLLENENIESINIPYFKKSISISSDIKTFKYLNNIIQDFKPDIISQHSSKAGILGRIAARKNNIKSVLTVHGWSFTTGVPFVKSIFYLIIERSLSFLNDKIILVSHYDKDLANKYSIAPNRKLKVIYNAVDDLSQNTLIESKKNDLVNISMIARLDQQKDHKSIIIACKDIEGIVLNFYGDGPNLKVLQKLILTLNLTQKVKLHGYTNEIPKILQNTDIFALISNWEGFPISTLEAMSMGKPIIISNVGGACECLEDGVNGFKVEKKSIKQIKEAINKFVNNKELIQLMGEKSRAIYLRDFTMEKMINETILTYNEILIK